MSEVIDSKVVEMRFDNKEFEANAKETINTLEDLKKALDENVSGEAFEELDRAAQNVDLSGIQAGIDAINDRFSTMGIVGMSVVNQLTEAITGKLMSAISSMFSAITEGGLRRAQNIENARFQLEGLVKDAEDVETIMGNASEAVDGTAFALDAAANAASQFAASGVEAGNDMLQALQAISGVAATTNSSYEDIARVFTTVAGNGRLMGDQLLQLSVRGLNAAASLKDYFNGVVNGSIEASESVSNLIHNLMGVTDAVGESAEQQLKAFQDELDLEYNTRKKTYDQEYKDLKKKLDAEYNAKKADYDRSYKLLQKSLQDELSALQKSNSKRLEEVQSAYQADVQAYRDATNERINLINQEYTESIKLIDEERYNKIKAIDDQIKAINDQAKAEERARELAQEEEERALLKKAVDNAKFTQTRKQAEEALAEFEEQIRQKRLKEERQDNIDKLNDQKTQINEEAQKKKEEAAKKREDAIKLVQEESNAKLEAMAKAHQEEMEAIREQQAAALEAMRETNSERLAQLREQQLAELSEVKEGQNAQLEYKKEIQNQDLKEYKEYLKEQLEATKETLAEEGMITAKFGNGLEVTEQDIREMVSKGLISFELFSEAMSTTFKDHAYDANATFQGAMSNIRSALARTGQAFYQPFIASGDSNPVIKFLNAIRVYINGINMVLAPVAETFTNFVLSLVPSLTAVVEKLSLVEEHLDENGEKVKEFTPLGNAVISIFDAIGNIFATIGSLAHSVVEAFKAVFSIDTNNFSGGVESFKEFTKQLRESRPIAKLVQKVFEGLFSVLKSIGIIFKSLLKVFSPFTRLLGMGSEGVSSFTDGVVGLAKALADWLETSETLNSVISFMAGLVSKFVDLIDKLTVAVSGSLTKAFGNARSIGSYFSEGFLNGMNSLIPDIITGVINFGKNLLSALAGILGIKSPSKETEELAKYTMEGYQEGLTKNENSVLNTISSIFTNFLNTIKSFFDNVDWKKEVESATDLATQFVQKLTDTISNMIDTVIEAVAGIFKGINDWFTGKKDEENGINTVGENGGKAFIEAIISGMGKMASSIFNGLVSIFTNTVESIKKHMQNFTVKGAIEAGEEFVFNFASTLIRAIGEWLGPIGEAFGHIFDKVSFGNLLAVGSGVGILFMIIMLAKKLEQATNPLSAFTKTMDEFTRSMKAATLDIKASALLKISAAIGILVGSFIWLYQVFGDEINWDKFMLTAGIMMTFIGVIGALFARIMKTEKKATNGIKALDSFLLGARQAVINVSNGIKSFLKMQGMAALFKAFAKSILDIAIAIASIAVIKHTYPESFKDALQVVISIVAVMSSLLITILGISAVMTDSSVKRVKDSCAAFLAVGAGIFLIVMAIQKILKIDINFKRDKDNLILLAGIFVVVSMVITQLAKAGRKIDEVSATVRASMIIGFCVLLLATVSAIKKLIKIGASITKNASQLLMLAVIFGMLLIVMKSIQKLNTSNTGNGLSMGSTIFGICGLLFVTIACIAILAKMDIVSYIKGLAMTAGIFAELYVVCMAAGKVQSSGGYKSLIGIAAIVAILMIAMGVLSTIQPSKLLSAATGLTEVLLALGGTLAAASMVHDPNSTWIIFMMLATICGIGIVLKVLGNMPWDSMLATGTAISSVMLAMGQVLKDVSSIKAEAEDLKKNAVLLLEGFLTVTLIGMVLWALSHGIDWKSMTSLAGSISVVILAMGKVMEDASSIETDAEGLCNSAGVLVEGIITVFLIAAILKWLGKDIDTKSILSLSAAVSIIMVAMGAMFRLILGITPSAEQAVGAALMVTTGALAVMAIAAALKRESGGTDWKELVGMAVAVSVVLLAIGVMCGIATLLGPTIEAALAGLVVIDAALLNFVGMLEILGAISEIPHFHELFDKGGEVLVGIAETIGRFCGALVNGAMTEASKVLPLIGTRISQFMTNMQPFFDTLALIDNDVAKKAALIGEVILALSVAEFIDALSRLAGFFVGDFDHTTFPGRLAALGEGITAFAEATNKITNVDDFEAIANATKAIVSVANELPNSGGWLGTILGENDIDKFGNMLCHFALVMPKISEYFAKVPKDGLDMFKPVSEAMKYIIEVATTLPNSGGWLGAVMGENDIDDFGSKLATFSNYLPLIAANFGSIPKDSVNSFKPISKAMRDIALAAKRLPNSGGWIDKVYGSNDADEFGLKLLLFSGHLVSIALITKGVNIKGAMDKLTRSIESIKNFSTNLRTAFIKYKKVGKKMDDLVDDITDYSGAISKISEDVKGNPLEKINLLYDTIFTVDVLAGKLKTSFSDYTKNKNLSKVIKDVEDYIDALTVIVSKSYSYNTTFLTNLYNTIPYMGTTKTYLETYFKSYNTTQIGNFIGDLNKYIDGLAEINGRESDISTATIVLNTVKDTLTHIDEIKTNIQTLGEYTSGKVSSFVTDVTDYISMLGEIAKTDISGVIEKLTTIATSLIAARTISQKFSAIFDNYKSKKFDDFIQDIRSYTSSLNFISQSSINDDILNKLWLMCKIMNDDTKTNYIGFLCYQFKALFNKYKANKFDDFIADLKSFATVLDEIMAMNIDDDLLNKLWLMCKLMNNETKTNYIGFLVDHIQTIFKGYKSSKKFNSFLEDLTSLATTVDGLKSYTIDLDQVGKVNDAANALNETFKPTLEAIGEYMQGMGFYQFTSDLKELIGAYKIVNESSFTNFSEKMDAMYLATNKFLNLMPQLSSFNANNFLDFLKKLKQCGEEAVKNFLQTFNNAKEDVVKYVAKFFGFITEAYTSKKELMTNMGHIIVKYVQEGMTDQISKNNITSAIRSVLQQIFFYINNNENNYSLMGLKIVKGVVKGIEDHLDEARKAGIKLGRAIMNGATSSEALDEHSPSRAMQQIGSYAGEGFVDGLIKWIKIASSTGSDLGAATLDTMQDAFSDAIYKIQNGDDFNPTITPILDLSSVEANANLIGSMLNFDKPIQLAANAGISFAGGINDILENIQAAIPDNANDDVVSAINDLRTDMNVMNQRLTNLQVVMDSGELVGVLADPIDQQIGYNAVLAERGVL